MLNLEKRLTLDGKEVPLVSDRVVLELDAVGRGIFRLRGDFADTLNAIARFLVGIRGNGTVYPVIAGVVTAAAPTVPGETRVEVREPAMLLDMRADFALRHVTPGQVLAEVEEITGLRFLLPTTGDYLTVRQPYFYAEGTCRQALEAMAEVWGVPRAVWATLPDGAIFWGDWNASPFNLDAVEIDARLVLERDPEARALVLPYLPRLRPGVLVSESFPFIVRRVTFEGARARLEWGEFDNPSS